jgi:hypothetical protein
MNLFLACLWIVAAIVTFSWEALTGDERFHLFIRGTNIRVSVGWIAVGLAVYNLIRWQMRRALLAEQRARRLAEAQYSTRRRHRDNEPGGEVDPNFQFTADAPPPSTPDITAKPPPGAPNRNSTDQPPSNN